MILKRLLPIVLILTSLQSPLHSQQIFSKIYGHFDYNYGKDILVEPDGFLILGNTGLNNGNSTPMLIKTDTAGKITKFVYQNSNDILSASKFIKYADKIYLCGTKNNPFTNDYDCFLSIYDTSLTFLKTVTFGGTSWDLANKIANIDTLLFIVGQSYSTSNGFSWGTISKFNLDGDSLDTYYYGMDGEASINSLITRGDSELVVTGWHQATDSLVSSAFVASYSITGTMNWNKNLSMDLGKSVGNDLTAGKLDHIYLCGTTELFSTTSKKDAFIYVLDSKGDSIRRLIQIHNNDEEMTSIAINANGNMITAGYTKTYGGGGKDFWFLEFEENGTYITGNTMGSDRDEYPAQIRYVPSDSGAVICGTTYMGGISNTSILVLKVNRSFLCNNTPTQEVNIETYIPSSNIRCYPNPATDCVAIHGTNAIESIELYDLMGHPIKYYTASMIVNNTIDISSIAPQLILVKVNSLHKSVILKMIKY